MHAHAADLRSEVLKERGRGGRDRAAADAFVAAVARDWRSAPPGWLDAVDTALCAYAEKLTRAPWSMREADVEALRVAGLDDPGIHDAIQVVSYFNYVNRVADAVHVDLEPEMPPYPDVPAAGGGDALGDPD